MHSLGIVACDTSPIALMGSAQEVLAIARGLAILPAFDPAFTASCKVEKSKNVLLGQILVTGAKLQGVIIHDEVVCPIGWMFCVVEDIAGSRNRYHLCPDLELSR